MTFFVKRSSLFASKMKRAFTSCTEHRWHKTKKQKPWNNTKQIIPWTENKEVFRFTSSVSSTRSFDHEKPKILTEYLLKKEKYLHPETNKKTADRSEITLTLGRTSKSIPSSWYGGGGGMEPPRSFRYVAAFWNDFTISGKPLIFLTKLKTFLFRKCFNWFLRLAF